MLQFDIKQSALLPALLLLQGSVEKKQAMPILGNVLIVIKNNELSVSATDTEVALTARLSGVSCVDDAEVTVPAKKLIDILRTLRADDLLQFKEDSAHVALRAGRSRFSLTTLPAKDFPLPGEEQNAREFYIETQALAGLLQATYFSMAQSDVRYFLNGVLIELTASKVTAVATDGHRLAMSQVKSQQSLQDGQFILPRKGVLELLRLIGELEDEKVLLSISENHFCLTSKSFLFTSKLIDGKFPSYRRVIPSNHDKALMVDRDLLKQSISRVSVLANEKYRAVEFKVTPCLLTIIARNQAQEEAIDELEVDTVGDSLSFGINASYLLDVLNHVPQGQVRLSYNTANEGLLVTSCVACEYQYVIMPLKI